MEFKEAMRIMRRMCKRPDCAECPIEACTVSGCRLCMETHPDNVESILTKWAAEHPEKTRLDDFLEKHPKAVLNDNGTPRACAKNLGYYDACIGVGGVDMCIDCWRRPLEEVE